MPQVSVVMPVYNGEKYLAEAIDSILNQTFTDFEFIIVDDGSTDGSAGIIRTYQERDERLRLVQLDHNMGRADARNAGIAVAQGELITSMDADDISLPERLEKQVAFLGSNPRIGGLGTCGHGMNHDMSSLYEDFIMPTRHELIALQHFLGFSVLGATVMFRREYLRAVEGFEAGRRYVDDLELISRLFYQTRIRLANLPEFLYLYRRHDQAKYRVRNSGPHIALKKLKRRDSERLGVPDHATAINRLKQLRPFHRLSWADRRRTKRDFKQIIDGMIAQGWVEPGDRSFLEAEMNRRLEQASPRLWQQFCHWRRHRFQRWESI